NHQEEFRCGKNDSRHRHYTRQESCDPCRGSAKNIGNKIDLEIELTTSRNSRQKRTMKITRALLISVLLWASSVDAAEVRKMIVPYPPLTGAPPPFGIAKKEKLLKNSGREIPPLFFAGGSSAIVPAMTAGQFDIGAVGGGAVVLNRFGGGDLITIGAQT